MHQMAPTTSWEDCSMQSTWTESVHDSMSPSRRVLIFELAESPSRESRLRVHGSESTTRSESERLGQLSPAVGHPEAHCPLDHADRRESLSR